MKNIASIIDHTLLKATATKEQITKLCEEAKEYHFASVCVNPDFVKLAASLLKGSEVKVCTVIGFPLGANTPTLKSYEAKEAIENGANEVDMVLNVSLVKMHEYKEVEEEIALVKKACGKTLLKVILETCYLTEEEIVESCLAAKRASADYVKTSTGFGSGGATTKDVALMRKTVGPEMGVKASGGVHNLAEAKAMLEAGATRIGASSGVLIAKEENE